MSSMRKQALISLNANMPPELFILERASVCNISLSDDLHMHIFK